MEDHTQTPLAPVANMVSLGGWSNLSAWAANMTTRYAPSLEDLVWVGPRILEKLGSYMAHGNHGDFAPDADANAGLLGTSAAYIYDIVDSTTSLTDHAAAPAPATGIRLSFESARSFGSILTYATSRWAMACIAMALILNRTHIFAATRRRLLLNWKLRLLLRFLPIILLVTQIRHLLMAMQCQTSAIFPELRWGDYSKHSRLLYAYPNKLINTFSSALLFGATDEQSCSAARMIPVQNQTAANQLQGSLSLLWPLFGTFCLSQFIETVSCAVQGRTLSAETGMTLFEQSLAFAEANQLGQLNFEIISKSATTEASSTTRAAVNLFTKSMIMKRVNTPPEVLLVSFLSAMTHLTSHLLGLFNLQSKYRLLNTGFWGLCFMGSLVWSACSFDLENSASQGFLRFPTVCIIGFVPHVLVLGGIILCLTIYSLALLLSALATPPNQERSSMTFRQRIVYAHENMQANVSFSEVRITRDMDFYTALLRTGFAAISMASEAVYLNEDRGVNLKRHTWLEEERYREAEELQKQWIGLGHASSKYDHIGAIGLIPVKDGPVLAPNGYARERAAQKVANSRAERSFRAGMGATDRSSRWVMALEFFLGIFKLACRVSALVTLWLLRLVRVKRQPGWLVRLAERPKTTTSTREEINQAAPANQMAGRSLGVIRNGRLPISDGIDVEAELRRIGQNVDEENLDKDLYNYFLENGWWGSGDCSGDYVPSHADDDEWDATSVVSVATTNTTDEKDGLKDTNAWEPDDDDDDDDGDAGQKTPTQSRSRMTRENTPVADSPMGMTDLARLLRPANREERDEATALAAHLVCDGVMTRARFRRLEQLRRTSILTSPRRRLDATTKTIPTTPVTPAIVTPALSAPATATTSRSVAMRDVRTKLDADEEEVLLEQLLISRRQDLAAVPSQQQQQQQQQQPRMLTTRNTTVETTGSAHAFASSEEGQEGPRCVVCQSAARTIIVWPCRCLSLCDDCRVSLAMNNFDKCVCCRRDVLSFSRIYVP